MPTRAAVNQRAGASVMSISAALVAVILLLAACAGDDGDGNDDDGSAAEPDAPTTEPTEPEPVSHASPGCGTDADAPVVEEERTLTVDDVERRYLLTVPSAHDGETPRPVVFDFHGLMEGAEIHAGMTAYSDLAEDEGFVVVYPHGTDVPVRWNISSESPNPDVVYFDAVLDQVTSTLCIDESRVYATGLSNGAMFTSMLICERAEVLAAAAPVAGIMDVDPCGQSRPVPIVSFHGTADPILLFNGGVDISAIPGSDDEDTSEVPDLVDPATEPPPVDLDGDGHPATVSTFAERNGCASDHTDHELTDEVIHRVYDCPDGADVEFYIVLDGGHTWPSSEFSRSIEAIVGHTTFDIDATRDAWEFMSRFTTR
ncbi:MAG: PHB depolymerase family esterase [Acidimicrobiales bacterium]|nr:PHB depolymerase family esterase [Acidimicrobiales bacterium]